MKSYDSCNTLIPVPIMLPNNFQYSSLNQIDTSTYYFLASEQSSSHDKIYKTTNGGYSWSEKFDTSGMSILFIEFFDANEGIAVNSTYQIIRTKNGGNSWQTGGSIPSLAPTAIKSYDSLVCIGFSDSGFLVSKDRGQSWFSGGGFGGFPAHSRDFFFLNKDTIFGVSSPGISGAYFTRSTNGGQSWQNKPLPINPVSIYFKSCIEGYVLGMDEENYGIIAKTDDLGNTWKVFNINVKTQLSGIVFLNDSIALVSGTNGVLFKWNSQSSVFTITGVKVFDKSELKLNVFPNPVKDKLHFEYTTSSPKALQLTITSTLGQIVYFNHNVDLKEELDLSFLKSGIYFLKIESEKEGRVLKIIKE